MAKRQILIPKQQLSDFLEKNYTVNVIHKTGAVYNVYLKALAHGVLTAKDMALRNHKWPLDDISEIWSDQPA